MYNVMHYHTADRKATILEQKHSKSAGEKALRAEARRRGATKAGDRYEIKARDYAITLYLECDTTVKFHPERMGVMGWERSPLGYDSYLEAQHTAEVWGRGHQTRIVKVTEEIVA